MKTAFTTKFNGLTKVLFNAVGISLPFDPQKDSQKPEIFNFNAIWDTGATNSVITKKIVGELKLKPVGKTNVQGVNGLSLENVYLINLYLPNKVAFPYIRVTECKNLTDDKLDVLIGMDVIARGSFAVTNFDNKTKMTFEYPAIRDIDFVAEISLEKRTRNSKVGRNNPCPCGSGKKFKKCCGK